MAKTTKKNNTALEWPNTHFTIDDLTKKYPNFVNITLRFRVKRGLDNKEIVTIGKVKPAIGRPRLVFAKVNPSKELLEAAKAAGVLPLEEKTASVTFSEVKTPAKKKKETTAPAVPTPEAIPAPVEQADNVATPTA